MSLSVLSDRKASPNRLKKEGSALTSRTEKPRSDAAYCKNPKDVTVTRFFPPALDFDSSGKAPFPDWF